MYLCMHANVHAYVYVYGFAGLQLSKLESILPTTMESESERLLICIYLSGREPVLGAQHCHGKSHDVPDVQTEQERVHLTGTVLEHKRQKNAEGLGTGLDGTGRK